MYNNILNYANHSCDSVSCNSCREYRRNRTQTPRVTHKHNIASVLSQNIFDDVYSFRYNSFVDVDVNKIQTMVKDIYYLDIITSIPIL